MSKQTNSTRIVIETYLDEKGEVIGELVIESNDLEFKVMTYGNNKGKDGKRTPTKRKFFSSEGGALRYILSLTLKEGKHETIEALLAGLGEITQYIKEKTDIVVAAREQKVKRTRVKAEVRNENGV